MEAAEPGTVAPQRGEPVERRSVTLLVAILAVLGVIAIVAALYLARAFFVPLLIGILASYALSPFVERLKAWHVPRAAGAALVLGALVAGIGWAAYSMGDDATAVIEGLPEAARKVRQHVVQSRQHGPTALQKIDEAATELQGAANDAARTSRSPSRPLRPGAVREAEPSVWLRDYVL